jgi:hypothetical protein
VGCGAGGAPSLQGKLWRHGASMREAGRDLVSVQRKLELHQLCWEDSG